MVLCFLQIMTAGKETENCNEPFVAIAFHWKEMDRQVRITGKAQRISGTESDEYFSSRPWKAGSAP